MNKLIFSLIIILTILTGSAFSEEQTSHSNPVYFNWGVEFIHTSNFFDEGNNAYIPFIYPGIGADFHLNDRVMITPECNVVFFLFIPVGVSVGGTVNYKFQRSFVGAGLKKWVSFYGDEDSPAWVTVNAGFSKKRTKYTFYLSIPFSRYERDENGVYTFGVTISHRL